MKEAGVACVMEQVAINPVARPFCSAISRMVGIDFPLAFVRWTENRNFQTILSAISKGQVDVKRLITEVVDLFENKLRTLLENYSFLKEENEVLFDKIAVLEDQITKEKQFKNEIEKKYQTLKIAKTIEGSKEDRRETKLKINALIREIDTCITQLSE